MEEDGTKCIKYFFVNLLHKVDCDIRDPLEDIDRRVTKINLMPREKPVSGKCAVKMVVMALLKRAVRLKCFMLITTFCKIIVTDLISCSSLKNNARQIF